MPAKKETLEEIHQLLAEQLLMELREAKKNNTRLDPRTLANAIRFCEEQGIRTPAVPNPSRAALDRLRESGKLDKLPRPNPADDASFK